MVEHSRERDGWTEPRDLFEFHAQTSSTEKSCILELIDLDNMLTFVDEYKKVKLSS